MATARGRGLIEHYLRAIVTAWDTIFKGAPK